MTDEVFGEDVDLNNIENTEDEVPQEETPEAEAVPAEEPKQEVKEPQTVPLATLLEERNEWKQRYKELEEKFSTGNKRLEELASAISGKAAPEQAVPEFEMDPLGNLRHKSEHIGSELNEFKKWRENLEASQKAQAEFASFQQRVSSAEAAFAESNPDYWEAAKFVAQKQKETLEAYGVPQEHLNNALLQNIIQLTATAMKQGKDPAKVTYELAKKSGWGAKTQGKDISTLKKGMDASKSVPSGKSGETSYSLEGLAALSDDDFDKLIDDPKAWERLGGRAQ